MTEKSHAVAGCAQCSLGFDLKPFLLLPASSFFVAAVCALNAALAELPYLRHTFMEDHCEVLQEFDKDQD